MTSWIEKKTKIAVATAASMLVTILMKMRPDTMTFRFPAQDRSEAIWQMRKPHVKKVSALTSNVVAKQLLRGGEAALHLAACNVTGGGVVAGCGGIAHPVGAVDAERNLEVVRCLGLDLNDRLGAIATLPAVFNDLVGDLRRRQRPGIASKTCCQRAAGHDQTCHDVSKRHVCGEGAPREGDKGNCVFGSHLDPGGHGFRHRFAEQVVLLGSVVHAAHHDGVEVVGNEALDANTDAGVECGTTDDLADVGWSLGGELDVLVTVDRHTCQLGCRAAERLGRCLGACRGVGYSAVKDKGMSHE